MAFITSDQSANASLKERGRHSPPKKTATKKTEHGDAKPLVWGTDRSGNPITLLVTRNQIVEIGNKSSFRDLSLLKETLETRQTNLNDQIGLAVELGASLSNTRTLPRSRSFDSVAAAVTQDPSENVVIGNDIAELASINSRITKLNHYLSRARVSQLQQKFSESINRTDPEPWQGFNFSRKKNKSVEPHINIDGFQMIPTIPGDPKERNAVVDAAVKNHMQRLGVVGKSSSPR